MDIARWSGIRFSSLFDDLNSQAEREDMLSALRKDDCFRIIDDPNGGSDTIVQVTEKGRDPRQLRITMQLIMMLNSLPQDKAKPFECSHRHFSRTLRIQRKK